MNESLFRKEAIQERLHQNLGSLTINLPIKIRVVALGGSVLMLIFICWLFLASTAETIHARGLLETIPGSIQLYPEKSGTLMKSFVHEGQLVKAGEALFLINANFQDDSNEEINKLLDEKLLALKKEEQLKATHLQALKKLYEQHYLSSGELHDSQLALLELQGRIKEATLNLMHQQQDKKIIIRSPIKAIARNIQGQKGQSVKASHPLALLIPYKKKLIAEFYLPASQTGFIKAGDPLKISYDAYPSTRFGFQKAQIQSINRSLLMNTEAEKQLKINEPAYKIIAMLDSQTLIIRGKSKSLQQGMPLTVVLQGEKRPLWQWIYQPLFDFYEAL